VQILADALVDARIAALHVKQRPHDVDIEFAGLELVTGDDVVGEPHDETRQFGVVHLGVAQLIEVSRRNHFAIEHQLVRQPRQC
jgi:hypothetical protein